MAIYKCLEDLQGKTLKYNDTVIIKDVNYEVRTSYLREFSGDNDRIFHILSIPSKKEFTTNAYGYKDFGGDWPECRLNDYEALTRCVIELYKIIEKTSITSEKEKWYKITTPGKTGISPEQVKTLITKYGGLVDPTLTYRSVLGIYVWAKGEEVVVYFNECNIKEDAIEVSPTTEITITKKEEKYENQFQRKKARIERGTRPEGSTVCGRRSKASVAIGHLSYRKVTGI